MRSVEMENKHWQVNTPFEERKTLSRTYLLCNVRIVERKMNQMQTRIGDASLKDLMNIILFFFAVFDLFMFK